METGKTSTNKNATNCIKIINVECCKLVMQLKGGLFLSWKWTKHTTPVKTLCNLKFQQN